jgi:hypothetical protein
MKNKILIFLLCLLPVFTMAQTEAFVKVDIVSSSQITIQSNKAFPNAVVLISRPASDAALSTITNYNNTIFVNNPPVKIRASNHNQMSTYLINNFAYTDVLTTNDAAYVGVNIGSNTYTHDCNSENVVVRVLETGTLAEIQIAYDLRVVGKLAIDSTVLGRMTDSLIAIDGKGIIHFIPRDSVIRVSGDTAFVGNDTLITGGLRPQYLPITNYADTFVVVDSNGIASKITGSTLDTISVPIDSLTSLSVDTLTARQILNIGDTATNNYITIENEIIKSDTAITIDSNLVVRGAHFDNVTSVGTPTYTLLPTDYILHVKYSLTGTCTITIPDAQNVRGRTIIVKDAEGNAAANNITITSGGDTFDGEASIIINGDHNGVAFYGDGTAWFILYILN